MKITTFIDNEQTVWMLNVCCSAVFVVVVQAVNVTSAQRGDVSLNPDLPFYQLVFGLMIASLLTICVIKTVCYVNVAFHAASTLHNNLLKKVRWIILT